MPNKRLHMRGEERLVERGTEETGVDERGGASELKMQHTHGKQHEAAIAVTNVC